MPLDGSAAVSCVGDMECSVHDTCTVVCSVCWQLSGVQSSSKTRGYSGRATKLCNDPHFLPAEHVHNLHHRAANSSFCNSSERKGVPRPAGRSRYLCEQQLCMRGRKSLHARENCSCSTRRGWCVRLRQPMVLRPAWHALLVTADGGLIIAAAAGLLRLFWPPNKTVRATLAA